MKIRIIIQDRIPTPHAFNRSFRVTQSADAYSYSTAKGTAFVWDMKIKKIRLSESVNSLP
jgi:hypothetical protein